MNFTYNIDFLESVVKKIVLGYLTISSVYSGINSNDFTTHCICGKDYKHIVILLRSIFLNTLLINHSTKFIDHSGFEKIDNKNKKIKLDNFMRQ